MELFLGLLVIGLFFGLCAWHNQQQQQPVRPKLTPEEAFAAWVRARGFDPAALTAEGQLIMRTLWEQEKQAKLTQALAGASWLVLHTHHGHHGHHHGHHGHHHGHHGGYW